MQEIVKFIQEGLKNVSDKSFNHLHSLDNGFHKISSKNIVFGINRGIRSIEPALRFSLGFASPIIFEFVLLTGILTLYCGSLYTFNMFATLGAYTYFTRETSKKRVVQIRDRKNIDKKQEFYQSESILNYEAVKAFGNEKLEKERY